MNWKIISKTLSVFCIPCLMLLMSFSAQAQSSTSLGNMYIPSKGFISVFNDINFENGGYGIQPGIIFTNRNSKPGVVNFVNASWTNANDFQHVDGYVQVLSDNAFTFPVGDLGFFKPISISGAKGTTAAYFLDNPNKLTNTVTRSATGSASSSAELVDISSDEYWHLTGKKATQVTLSWDVNSDIAGLTQGDLNRLQIVGYNGTDWVVIPSEINDYVLDTNNSNGTLSNTESDLSSGSITTKLSIVPNEFKYLSFGAMGIDSANEEIPFNSEIIGKENIEMTVFPNPTFDLSNVRVDYNLNNLESDAFIVVFSTEGQLVFKEKLVENSTIYRFDHAHNTDGLYQIGIITESGSKMFKPVMISNK